MLVPVLHVAVCVYAMIHAASPTTYWVGPKITPAPHRPCCSDKPCGGECLPYCRYDKPIRLTFCKCSRGLQCCRKRNTTLTRCEKCNTMFKCVPSYVHCAARIVSRTCTCPAGKKCCRGPFCFECGGRCMKVCRRPYYRYTNSRCPCPRGMSCCKLGRCPYPIRTPADCRRRGGWPIHALGVPAGRVCCKLPTCERNCRQYKARCVPPATCRHRLTSLAARCSCRPGLVCCKFTCELGGCKGRCVQNKCYKSMKTMSSKMCTCQRGFSCCKPPLPRCERCSRLYKCVPSSVRCAYPVRKIGCTCPARRKCCKGPFCFSCGGRCLRGACRRPYYRINNARCPCPRGWSCCKLATCLSNRACGPSMNCIPVRSPCANRVGGARCSCPPGKKCCRYTCELGGCRGKCVWGRCHRWMKRTLNPRSCSCPVGFSCCQYTLPRCERCNALYKCVPTRVRCAVPLKGIKRLLCPCPKGTKCCKGPFCFHCGGRCLRGRCRRPYYQIVNAKCPCPKGMSCCKLATCWSNRACGRYRNCIPVRSPCANPVGGARCSCPPNQKCCRYKCQTAPCNSLCIRSKCSPHMKSPRPICNCQAGYKCCQGRCPYKTRTITECNWLGGWLIPATGNPAGRYCCKLPTCAMNCVGYKAQCAVHSTCRYKLTSRAAKCSCRPGLVCCRYRCEGDCRGTCVRGPCQPGMKALNLTCTCPIGFSCCLLPCVYKPCVPAYRCPRSVGTVVPVWDCPRGTVCCKGSCPCPHKPCRTLAFCRYMRGTIIPSSDCLNGRVCCRKYRYTTWYYAKRTTRVRKSVTTTPTYTTTS